MELDNKETKRLLEKLSKHELEKFTKNIQRITFDFKPGKSFFKYASHPITIPKEFYPFLDFHGIAKKQETRIVFPDSTTARGYIRNSVAGYGEYYQICIRNFYSGAGLSKLKVGDIVKVKIFKEEKTNITNIVLSLKNN